MRVLSLGALLAGIAGCEEPWHPQPDISDLSVLVTWGDDVSRDIEVSISDADIPCSGSERDLVSESGIQCTSAPWDLVVDGTPIETSVVSCESAYDGLLGPVPKQCEGGVGRGPLPDSAGEDVEIVAMTEVDETHLTLHGVRGQYVFVEEAPYHSSFEPGIGRVDGLELIGGSFTALYTPADGGSEIRDYAGVVDGDPSRLELSPSSIEVAGVYDVLVLAAAGLDGTHVAVPIEGSLTIDPR